MTIPPFHLAFPIRAIEPTRAFYQGVLGCAVGREAERWIDFVIEPYVRFAGQPGEQATMFFRDPSGNALEFKSFRDPARIFAR